MLSQALNLIANLISMPSQISEVQVLQRTSAISSCGGKSEFMEHILACKYLNWKLAKWMIMSY
jgi:hypothetical protein